MAMTQESRDRILQWLAAAVLLAPLGELISYKIGSRERPPTMADLRAMVHEEVEREAESIWLREHPNKPAKIDNGEGL